MNKKYIVSALLLAISLSLGCNNISDNISSGNGISEETGSESFASSETTESISDSINESVDSSKNESVVSSKTESTDSNNNESRSSEMSSRVSSLPTQSKIDNGVKRSSIPIISYKNNASSFEVDGRKYVLWGVETDQWLSAASSIFMIDRYVEASLYVNANTLAVHAPWRMIEPYEDEYDFSVLRYYLEQTEKAGLKAVIYFTSTNYAAGNMQFVPDYIINDSEKYTKIQGDPKYFRSTPWQNQPSLPLCPSNPSLLDRERKAYVELIKFIKEFDTNSNVLSIQVGGETNFFTALNDEYMVPPNVDVRCECQHCNKAFVGHVGSNLEFMTNQYAVYIKKIIEGGAVHYDLPTYTCSAPKEYWGGDWRYAENSAIRKKIVGKQNYFVGPSIAETFSVATFTKEMNHYLDNKIPGNFPWASGIDTGHGTPGSPQENSTVQSWKQLEMAPWFIGFKYKGLGAIYWDHPDVSITNETRGAPVREKFRAMWSPIRAVSSILTDIRILPLSRGNWWHFDEPKKVITAGLYKVEISQTKSNNYGLAYQLDDGSLIFAATTYSGGQTKVEISKTSGYNNAVFQRGYFSDSGKWISTGTFKPTINGEKINFEIKGDHGEYKTSIYRISFK